MGYRVSSPGAGLQREDQMSKFITALFINKLKFKKWEDIPCPPPSSWKFPLPPDLSDTPFFDAPIPIGKVISYVEFRFEKLILFRGEEIALYYEDHS